jgi:hypothetical protein
VPYKHSCEPSRVFKKFRKRTEAEALKSRVPPSVASRPICEHINTLSGTFMFRFAVPANKPNSSNFGGISVPEAATPICTTAWVLVRTAALMDPLMAGIGPLAGQDIFSSKTGNVMSISIGGRVFVLFLLKEVNSKRKHEDMKGKNRKSDPYSYGHSLQSL